ncbi:MAG: preprotein translocase subunit SecE [Candidatus Paceibacterota bacterium]
MNRLITYLREVRGEMTHVSWPTQKQATIFTVLVIIISILTSLYLGLFDFIFTYLLENFVI